MKYQLKCKTCGADFTHEKMATKYCSEECRSNRTCSTCGKKFADRNNKKKYCSLDCYIKDPVQTERRRARANPENTTMFHCLNCGKEVKRWKSTIAYRKSKHQFCGRGCYHEFLAKRFDRYIHSNTTIKDFNNFDEFLSQEALPCPVVGCDWTGKNLSSHINFEHGIRARDFKKLAGFNKQTALWGRELLERAQSRPVNCDHLFKIGHAKMGAASFEEPRKEGRERYTKAMRLRWESEETETAICKYCGSEFQKRKANPRQYYCSKKCQGAAMYERAKENKIKK